MFLLPGGIPHSPQRFADTVGIVIERARLHDEPNDALLWYCDKCAALVYEETFFCTNLGVQLVPVIERYYASEQLRTCKACGHLNPIPSQPGKNGPPASVVVESVVDE